MNALDLFPDAPCGKQKFPQGKIVGDVLIEGNYRRWLKYAWGPGPAIGIIGLNPSDANASRRDPTMNREIGFAFRWGFGSLVKVNLSPFISANPAANAKWREAATLGDELNNDARNAYIQNFYDIAAQLAGVDKVWAAWGNGAEPEDIAFLHFALTDDNSKRVTLWCIGKNADGSPKHTLARGVHRVPDEAELQVWETWCADDLVGGFWGDA